MRTTLKTHLPPGPNARQDEISRSGEPLTPTIQVGCAQTAAARGWGGWGGEGGGIIGVRGSRKRDISSLRALGPGGRQVLRVVRAACALFDVFEET